jgi:hypothetical protein
MIPSMKENNRFNCVGYVYGNLGITPIEKYIEPPLASKLFEHFDRVDTANQADAVATIEMSKKGLVVTHMARVVDSGKSVKHRKGAGSDVSGGELNTEISGYVNSWETEVVYLVLKEKKKWFF